MHTRCVRFLLGVSKNLMYSALPGHCHGELASACRPDSHLFRHGCPVYEVYAHNSRITSLAVSSFGNFVATGDEHGLLKVSYVFPVEGGMQRQAGNHRNDMKHNLSHISYERSNSTIKAHERNIFAINFTPYTNVSPNSRVLLLATGSDDCVVRLWRVVCSKEEMTVTAHMLLSTMSCSILCISSIEVSRECSSTGNSIGVEDTQFIVGQSTSGEKTKDNLWPHSVSTTILTAGTSAGAMYIWKLSNEDIYTIDTYEDGPIYGTIGGNLNECQGVDRHRLTSLVFASEHPIVHVSPAVATSIKTTLCGKPFIHLFTHKTRSMRRNILTDHRQS